MAEIIIPSNCAWCQSTRLEKRRSGNELSRVHRCMECGASSTSSIIVDEKALLGLCRQNKKITAIKLHRHVTGASIEESKAFIKNLMEYM